MTNPPSRQSDGPAAAEASRVQALSEAGIPAAEAARRLRANGLCTTGKRVYFKANLANRAITEAARRGELPTMRHYQCPACGWWHLSRKDRSRKEEA